MVFKRDYCPNCRGPMFWYFIIVFGGRTDVGVCRKCGYREEFQTSTLPPMKGE